MYLSPVLIIVNILIFSPASTAEDDYNDYYDIDEYYDEADYEFYDYNEEGDYEMEESEEDEALKEEIVEFVEYYEDDVVNGYGQEYVF